MTAATSGERRATSSEEQGTVSSRRRSFRDLRVWQEGCKLALSVYSLTSSFPHHQAYALVSQMQRAAISIPANIAEGRARKGEAEFIHFLHQAAGSLAELETCLELVRTLGYASVEDLTIVENQAGEVGKMLYGLLARVKSSQPAARSAQRAARSRPEGAR